MSHFNPFSADQWIQQQQQQQYQNPTPIAAADSKDYSGHGMRNASISSSNTQPQGSSGGNKPIRRRSRASKKTPTTLLNASPNDFRALVQRFTGYNPGNASSSASAGSLPKGPLNINFAQNDPTTESSRYGYYNISSQPASGLPLQDLQNEGGLNNMNGGVDHELVDESSFTEAAPGPGLGGGYYF